MLFIEGEVMKKTVIIILLYSFLIIGLAGCKNVLGNVTNVKLKAVSSEIYAQEEIENAINIIKNDFKENWGGCKLNEISYVGDERNDDFIDWATKNNKEEVIVLTSNFYVGSSTKDISLNLNSEYNNWNWILVRNKNENWQHKDHGF